MSLRAMTWAWEQDGLDPTAKLLLMALADHANDDGDCWPGQERLSERVGVSDRSIRRHLTTLSDADLLTVTTVRSDGGTMARNTYRLHLGTTGRPCPVVEPDHRTPVSADHRTPVSGEPSVQNQGLPSTPVKGTSETAASRPPTLGEREAPRLCRMLAENVQQALGLNELPPGWDGKRWQDSCRLLIDVGPPGFTKQGATVKQVEYVIRWATASEFWRGNIRSMPTLREKWLTLVGQIEADRAKKPTSKGARQEERQQSRSDALRRLAANG